MKVDSQMHDAQRFDQGVVSSAEITDEGYLKATAVVTRTGIFKYMNSDGTVRRELRHPDDIFKSDSLASLKMRPITNGHPEQKLVKADNAKELSIGYTGEKVNTDGEFLVTSLLITDGEGVEAVKSGKKRELSLGYTVDLVREDGVYNGESYDYRQTNIKYNHLAIVERGRAGADARINFDSFNSDELVACDDDYIASIKSKTEKKIMTEEKFAVVTLDGLEYKSSPEVARAYDKAVKELETTATKLDSLNTELETLKAEKDSLAEKLEAATNVDHAAEIKEAVKNRVSLIANAKKLLGNKSDEINMDDMSDVEIVTSIVKEKCPKANLDEASEVYIKARFDALLEDIDNDDAAIARQRELVAPKLDAKSKDMDVEDARERMMKRMKDGYKRDKTKK